MIVLFITDKYICQNESVQNGDTRVVDYLGKYSVSKSSFHKNFLMKRFKRQKYQSISIPFSKFFNQGSRDYMINACPNEMIVRRGSMIPAFN